MPVLKGINKANVDQGGKVSANDAMGSVKMLRDKIVVNGSVLVGDIYKMGSQLPAGAKVLQAMFNVSGFSGAAFGMGYDSQLGFNANYQYFIFDGTVMAGNTNTIVGINAEPIERDLDVAVRVTTGEVGTVTDATIELIVLYVDN